MSEKEKLEIVMKALRMACKFMRENPPGDIDAYPIDMIQNVLVGGTDDPEGKKYMRYFLYQAMK